MASLRTLRPSFGLALIPILVASQLEARATQGADCSGGDVLGPGVGHAVGSSPIALAVGDFREDGAPDIAVVNYSDGTVSILLGNMSQGAPTRLFSPQQAFPAGSAPRNIVTGDFDRDGILDLAIPNLSGSPRVSILKGLGTAGVGNGSFALPVIYPVAPDPRGIASADFNSDGILDLAVGTDVGISILLGRGDGSFTANLTYSSLAVWGIATGDFDEDGVLDLAAVGSTHNSLLLFRGGGPSGQGDGTFTQTVAATLTSGAENVASEDLDEDGHADLAVGTASAATVLYGNGSGAFLRQTSTAATDCINGIAVGRLNGDTKPDLAVTSSCLTYVSVIPNQGTSFATPHPFPTGSTPTDVLIDDVDLDGAQDVALVEIATSRIDVFFGNCYWPGPPVVTGFDPDSGSVGASVTLYGRGLKDVTSVTFNGVSAAIVNAFPSIVRTLVPEGATTGSISVTAPLGTATTARPFVVGERPFIASAAPDSGRVGTVVLIRGQHFGSTRHVAFGPASHPDFTVLSEEEIRAVVDSSAVTDSITVTTAFGSDTSEFVFIVRPPRLAPTLHGIRDIPSDQGGRVLVLWDASDFDRAPNRVVSSYRVWRRAPSFSLAPSRVSAMRSDPAVPEIEVFGDFWELVGELPASQLDGYALTTATFGDSTAAGIPYATFFVQSVTPDPFVFYNSFPDSGYSVDNTPPGPPQSVFANYGDGVTSLRWAGNHEPDLSGYEVHRGESEDFQTSSKTRASSQRDTTYIDVGSNLSGLYYKVTAVDLHGNRGPFTQARRLQPTDVGVPTLAVLRGVHPNPSNGAFTVSLALGRDAPATLEVLDLHGRRLLLRDLRDLAPGAQEVSIDDVAGLAPGLYLVRLKQGPRSQTSRVAIVR